ncbi:MAG: hypothetical protein J5806_11430 [Lentisphaeria bacterium]|nr:hypothetical protein [Lentisphaeria bacterium]
MRNLTTAVFLTFIFCAVSAGGKDVAKGSDQDSSFESAVSSMMSATKKMFGEVKTFFGFGESDKAKQTASKKQNAASSRSFRNTLWEEKLKEWEKRHSPVPKSLPRVDFKSHRPSSSRSYRAPHRSFRSSHRRVTHHSSRGGKIHIKIKSKRR